MTTLTKLSWNVEYTILFIIHKRFLLVLFKLLSAGLGHKGGGMEEKQPRTSLIATKCQGKIVLYQK